MAMSPKYTGARNLATSGNATCYLFADRVVDWDDFADSGHAFHASDQAFDLAARSDLFGAGSALGTVLTAIDSTCLHLLV
jgi:hypothetical protein